MHVVRWMDIFCDESMDQLIREDIPRYEDDGKDENEDEDDKNLEKEYKNAA